MTPRNVPLKRLPSEISARVLYKKRSDRIEASINAWRSDLRSRDCIFVEINEIAESYGIARLVSLGERVESQCVFKPSGENSKSERIEA